MLRQGLCLSSQLMEMDESPCTHWRSALFKASVAESWPRIRDLKLSTGAGIIPVFCPISRCCNLDLQNAFSTGALLSWGFNTKERDLAGLSGEKYLEITEHTNLFFFFLIPMALAIRWVLEYLQGPVHQWQEQQLWEHVSNAVSVFILLSGKMCRCCRAPRCCGYSWNTTWAPWLPKSAREESGRMAVSTINARQSRSEPPSTTNTLWAGDDLGLAVPEAPLGRKNSCKIWFPFIPVQF